MANALVGFLKRQAKHLLLRSSFFFTFHLRPKYARDICNWQPLPDASPVRVALIMQGPLWRRDDFTLETLRLYRQNCPDAIVILSTWDDEDGQAIAAIRAEGVEVVINRKPSEAGLWNMNLQMVSAYAGLARAKALGAELALKTRTDIRFYAPHTERFLVAVVSAFPLASGGTQKRRVVGFDVGTVKHRLYGLSDLNLFGDVDDLLLYFAPDPDDPCWVLRGGENNSENVQVPETYFASRFLTRVGFSPQWTPEDSDHMFATRFCVLDQDMVDMYWPKYNAYREHKYLFYDTNRPENAYLKFRDWLILRDRFSRQA